MSKLGFGIDGGGTRSRLCVFDLETGAELGRFMGGSTNMYSVGAEAAFANIEALLRSTGFVLTDFQKGCLGSAGLSRPNEQKLYSEFFFRLLPQCQMYLCNDGEILLVGGLESLEGYSLIGGTGSFALARAADGATARAGGLGYMLGDEGSALWIAWEGIKRSLRSMEGRDLDTCLLPLMVEHFKLENSTDFVGLMHQRFQKAEIAAAARIVLEHTETDPLAKDIAEKAVEELAWLVRSVVKQMPLKQKRVALSGGVIENNEFIRKGLIKVLQREYPDMNFVMGPGDAVMGACMLARSI